MAQRSAAACDMMLVCAPLSTNAFTLCPFTCVAWPLHFHMGRQSRPHEWPSHDGPDGAVGESLSLDEMHHRSPRWSSCMIAVSCDRSRTMSATQTAADSCYIPQEQSLTHPNSCAMSCSLICMRNVEPSRHHNRET